MKTLEHKVVSREEWLEKRRELLVKEKAHTRAGDALSKERMELPWVKVEKDYTFEGPNGQLSLADLFDGRSQLIVYHFMYAPGWEQGCEGCSFLCDHIDGANQHIKHHDVSLVAVSRAPYAELAPYKKRMGWEFDWYSSAPSDFNYDYSASFKAGVPSMYNFVPNTEDKDEDWPGISVFYKDENGDIYHTYSSYSRGGDIHIGAHNWLDIAPLGRNESSTMNWMKRHDEYEGAK